MPSYRNKPPLSYYRTALPGVDYSELQGKLIVIEGPDAVGRSTQVRRLKPWLESGVSAGNKGKQERIWPIKLYFSAVQREWPWWLLPW